jgi:muramoyltetrapeptide carboxypeptidase
MNRNRRNFLRTLGLSAITTQLPLSAQRNPSPTTILKPPRLKVGDTVGLISPAGYIDRKDIEDIKKDLAKLGLKVKLGAHVYNRYGYLAGSDANRAADVNAMFADSSVQAILPMRGGWGCNRILPLLDYSLIRTHPKIIIGLSDITSLLIGIYANSGLVTFHGPTGQSTWNPFTVDYVKRVLFNGEVFTLQNLKTSDNRTITPVQTITSGKARGKLVGGNLSVLSAMVGSPYLPSWKDTILFLEDIGRGGLPVDRMLTQLKLSGFWNKLPGLSLGNVPIAIALPRRTPRRMGRSR